MTSTLTLAIPCRADEPGFEATLQSLFVACQHPELPSGCIVELLICINGLRKGDMCLPLRATHNCCARHGVPLEEVWVGEREPLRLVPSDFSSVRHAHEGESAALQTCAQRTLPLMHERTRDSSASSLRMTGHYGAESSDLPIPSCTVLLTERKGKPPAWNALWVRARGKMVLFCDADVRIETEAIFHLYRRLQHDAGLRLVAAREVPLLQGQGTVWSRLGAIPYRFNFGNAGGRLLVMCKDALPGTIPEDLLLEDAWLTVAVGTQYVAKETRALVFFLPPATWSDYFAERVRTEGGKLQIRREHRGLLTTGPVARYQWREFWRQIRLHEYPLVFLAVVLRIVARGWAWLALTRKDFYALYHPFRSTKEWSQHQTTEER